MNHVHPHPRVGQSVYTEALESYRDDGKSRHRCIARWPADQPFAVALASARYAFADVRKSRAYWQGILDGTLPPRLGRLRRRTPDRPKDAQRHLAWLDRGVAHLAALEAVQAKLLPATEADIQAATEAVRQEWERVRQQTPAFTVPATRP